MDGLVLREALVRAAAAGCGLRSATMRESITSRASQRPVFIASISWSRLQKTATVMGLDQPWKMAGL